MINRNILFIFLCLICALSVYLGIRVKEHFINNLSSGNQPKCLNLPQYTQPDDYTKYCKKDGSTSLWTKQNVNGRVDGAMCCSDRLYKPPQYDTRVW
jgi:hypothetical protein